MLQSESEKLAKEFFDARPTMRERQADPIIQHEIAVSEAIELGIELQEGNRAKILDELADFVFTNAVSVSTIKAKYGITDEEIIAQMQYKMRIRNGHKYPPENYQDGDAGEQQRADANLWRFLSIYFFTPELGIDPEYY